MKKIGINLQVKKIDPTLWGTRRGANDLMSTMFWTHDNGWGGGTGLNEATEQNGVLWNLWYTSRGASGVEPPAWAKQGYEIKKAWWTAVPGSEAWQKASDEAAKWQRDNLPIIKIVEGVKYPMIASTKLGNVATGGYAIGLNFGGEQLFFNE
jgi:peptide/nickel transport system substrate-binding protein